MNDIKLVALDMDGTLLTSNEDISPYTKDVIKRAMDKNVHVVLSTGRALATSYPYAEELDLTSYIITCNGGEIWTMQKELLEQHLMETRLIEKMWYLGQQQKVTMWMVSTDEVFRNRRPDDFHIHKWLKFGCQTADESKLNYMLKELSHLQNVELTNSLPTNMEINPKGVHKANAIKRVCKELGITMDHVMAVGDSLNDMKMIQQAGIGVAMGNAQEAVKKASDVITGTNDGEGVAQAIEQNVL